MLGLEVGQVDEHGLLHRLVGVPEHALLEHQPELHLLLPLSLDESHLLDDVGDEVRVLQSPGLFRHLFTLARRGRAGHQLLRGHEQTERVVVLQADYPGQRLRGFAHRGHDVVRELLEGFVQEESDGIHLPSSLEGLDLLGRGRVPARAGLGASLEREQGLVRQVFDGAQGGVGVGALVDVLRDKSEEGLGRGHRRAGEVEDLPGAHEALGVVVTPRVSQGYQEQLVP